MNPHWIIPSWPAPAGVRAFSTTRAGGNSQGPWHSLNLGLNCHDDPVAVAHNRAVVRSWLPAEPIWLRQEHGITVYRYPHGEGEGAGAGAAMQSPVADAQVAWQAGQVCAVLTADCLPVLFCDRHGTGVAAAHAGWRGLLAGVLEHTVQAMEVNPSNLLAWLGPAIGPRHYTVGDEVRNAFLGADQEAHPAFTRSGDRWLLDLYAMARQRLAQAGVHAVFGGEYCTFSDPERFYSFRRDGTTGRMASLVWLEVSS